MMGRFRSSPHTLKRGKTVLQHHCQVAVFLAALDFQGQWTAEATSSDPLGKTSPFECPLAGQLVQINLSVVVIQVQAAEA